MKTIVNFVIKLFLKANQLLYNQLAWAYDFVSWLAGLGQWHAVRKGALDHITGEDILEIGFGTGELLTEIQRRGWQPCGLELSPNMIKISQKKLFSRNLQNKIVQGSTLYLPYKANSFDTIVCTFPAEFILAPQTLQEASRVLRKAENENSPCGRLIIAGTSLHTENPILRKKMEKHNPSAGKKIMQLFNELAEKQGFEITIYEQKHKWVYAPLLVLDLKQN